MCLFDLWGRGLPAGGDSDISIFPGRSEQSERSPISLPARPVQFVKNGQKRLLWRAKRAFEDGR